MRERHNAKARQGSLHKKKKQRFVKAPAAPASEAPTAHADALDSYSATATPVPLLLDAKAEREPVQTPSILDLLPEKPEGKVSSKKRKRLEKFIQSQLKKEERVKLVKKLGDQHLDEKLGELLKSTLARILTRELSHVQKQTAKEKLRQSLKEHRSGIPISDPSSRLFVEHEQQGSIQDFSNFNDDYMDEVEEDSDLDIKHQQKDTKSAFGAALNSASTSGFGSSLKANSDAAFGSAMKKAADGSFVPVNIVKRKKKKQVKKKTPVVEQKFNGLSSDEDEDHYMEGDGEDGAPEEVATEHAEADDDEGEDEENDESEVESESEQPKRTFGKPKGPVWNSDVVSGVVLPHQPAKKPKLDPEPKPLVDAKPATGPRANQYYAQINRSSETELARMSLPILREEQAIMEAIINKTTTILCGETG
ncbi:hypothetical protein BC830DRAFT_1167172 [Chytriomyces sp. MP71]|nr:hypothetical protein BC830DRAFT_1167172 [Chytriomyces sp. MP71]